MQTTVIERIKVTAEDIALGVRESCLRCPIARAMQRQGYGTPSVQTHTALFTRDGVDYEGRLPAVARAFVCRFDNHASNIQPFEFDLEVVVSE